MILSEPPTSVHTCPPLATNKAGPSQRVRLPLSQLTVELTSWEQGPGQTGRPMYVTQHLSLLGPDSTDATLRFGPPDRLAKESSGNTARLFFTGGVETQK